MPINVRIPTPLRQLTGGEETVIVTAASVGAAIAELQAKYPGIKDRLLDDKGEVRRFVNVYVNEEDIRFLQNQATPLKDGDEISIIPAIAGG
ncbi:MAG: MoaD family protein [Limisphaerales bacterium]|nr:MAG: MoaD family protein [Limisphaerales bacterium]KAG0508521.1 MAG: MoaD family protein [Limisphaerales bacterium]TXT46583.1 MAG: MoaD family protein [Limisphaerales bacterium]